MTMVPCSCARNTERLNGSREGMLLCRLEILIQHSTFNIERRMRFPMIPERHLSPALSPTSWRRGRKEYAPDFFNRQFQSHTLLSTQY